MPTLDVNQNYKIISGSESNGTTTLKFSRLFRTGDAKDIPLEVSKLLYYDLLKIIL